MKDLLVKLDLLVTEKRRKYVYRLATLGLLALATYGVIGPGELELWTLIAAAVTGMADANTSKEEPEDPYVDDESDVQDDDAEE